MPFSEDFASWFTFWCQWLHEKTVQERHGPLEADFTYECDNEEAPFCRIADDSRLRSYPILSGHRYEIVQAILRHLDHPANPDHTTYPELARIVLIWNGLPILVLRNARFPDPSPEKVTLIMDVGLLAAKTYIFPVPREQVVATKRWQMIGLGCLFAGTAMLLGSSNGTRAS